MLLVEDPVASDHERLPLTSLRIFDRHLCADVDLTDDAPFDDAPIEDSEITCPRHGARFCLRTGDALSPPAYEPLRIFEVRESGGRIEIRP